MRRLLVVTLLAVLCAACASRPPSSASSSDRLGGVTWIDVAADTTAIFGPGTIHLSDGCSGFTSSLTSHAHTMRMGRQIGQAYMCGGPVLKTGTPAYFAERRRAAAEDVLDRMLTRGARWSVAGSTLTLADESRTVTLTSRGGAPLTLPGSRWRLGMIATLHPTTVGELVGPRISFDAHDGFRATDSCDDLGGTVTITDDTIAFHTDTHSEHRSCPRPRIPLVLQTIDTLLNTTVRYQIEDNTLRLHALSGDAELRYEPA